VGSRGQGWQPLDALIDQVHISTAARYEKDFTPDERFATDKDTLLLYRCDEGQGEELKDASGHGHHGKIIGAKWVKTGRPSSAAGPAITPANDWVNVLVTVDPSADGLGGTWKRQGSLLSGESGAPSLVRVPLEIEGSYAFQLDFRGVVAGRALNIVLPVGDRSVMFVLDGWDERHLTGLQKIGGKELIDPENPTTLRRDLRITAEQAYRVEGSVELDGTKARIEVKGLGVNGGLVDWRGEIDSLSSDALWAPQPRTMYWAVPNGGAITIINGRIRMLSGEARFLRPAAVKGKPAAANPMHESPRD
jgi:hypothetical protein